MGKSLNSLSNSLSTRQIIEFQPDILHETYYSTIPLGYLSPRVLTVYDFIHEIFYPGNNEKIKAKYDAMSRANRIITISKSTTKDLIEFYPEFKSKIVMIHLAPSEIFRSPKKYRKVAKPYILFVGSRGRYKNFSSLAAAFSESDYLKKNYELHLFGDQKLSRVELMTFRKLGISNCVKFSSGNNLDLLAEYQGASLLVYPSLYEGFGLPILEAMSAGCPVLSTALGSMREVSGDSGYFFDAENRWDLKNKIEKVLRNQSLRDELIHNGLENSAKYTLRQLALETKSVYEEMIN